MGDDITRLVLDHFTARNFCLFFGLAFVLNTNI